MFKKTLLVSTLLALSFGVSAQAADVLNPNNPEKYQGFKHDYYDMLETVNQAKLSYRNFYAVPSEGPDAAWFDAVKRGDVEAVKKMIEAGQNLEVKDEKQLGQTALVWAAFIGDEEMVDLLIEKGASLDGQDRGDVWNVLKSAGLGNNLNVFKKLYEMQKDTTDFDDQTHDRQGETFMIIAASNNRLDLVKFLLEKGANPNLVTTIKDEEDGAYNHSAMSFACQRGYVEMVKLLADNGGINHRTGAPVCE